MDAPHFRATGLESCQKQFGDVSAQEWRIVINAYEAHASSSVFLVRRARPELSHFSHSCIDRS